jgi:hypothetical protein
LYFDPHSKKGHLKRVSDDLSLFLHVFLYPGCFVEALQQIHQSVFPNIPLTEYHRALQHTISDIVMQSRLPNIATDGDS